MRSLAFIILLLCLFSCRKNNSEANAPFYGKWSTSYADTVSFYSSGDRSYISYDKSMSPSAPSVTVEEFAFRNNKLSIKNGLNGPGKFYTLNSFSWVNPGKVFRVQAVEWFNFISSTTTWFTFTKIP